MKVRFTTEAKADSRQIGDYSAKNDPLRALSFIDELEQKCLSLATSSKDFLWCLDMKGTSFVAECMGAI